MEKPVLILMAAGMGSRYGGLKQMDKIDDHGHVLMDYSLYDAVQAGFETAIFVIKKEMEDIFEETLGKRLRKHLDIKYAFQSIDALPNGYSVPEGRVKPWGTGHAVLSCYDLVKGPFSVINADDYYGRHAFSSVFDFLTHNNNPNAHSMVGYKIENTLTENGYVSRGICQLNADSCLTGIVERVHIEKAEGGAVFTEDDKSELIPNGTIVSMNMWGFHHSMMEAIKTTFPQWLSEKLSTDPLKAEYFLPLIPNIMIQDGSGTVHVLPTDEKWYGITYHEDKASVVAALKAMRDSGKYPEDLWGNN